jgi:oxygen-independent coproporphyrinogen-3 oxidase
MRTLTALPRPRDVLHEFGIYVHVPFCTHRCWYCDFNAYAGLDHFAEAYMDALVRDIELARSAPNGADLDTRPVVTSVFIGGGTPTLVPAQSIARVMRAVRDAWPTSPEAEITIECNPESLDASKLDTYLEAGINRVSIGVQSLDPELLARLGRTHSARDAVERLRLARSRGFENVSADLIFGVPGETDDTWRISLEGVLACEPTHVSCYALTYEEGTPLDSWRKIGRITPVDEDAVAARWETAEATMTMHGFGRYEISNWAKPGAASRHNSLYWRCGEYLGVGAGAHSHLANADGTVRSWTVRGPERYIDSVRAGSTTVSGSEHIDGRTRASEVMILGLRRTEGVGFDDFTELVGRPISEVFSDELRRGLAQGLLDAGGERVRLVNPLLGNAAAVLFA